METNGFAPDQVLVEENMNVMFCVVDQPERRNRTRCNAKVFHHTLVRSKGKFTLPELFFKIMNPHMHGMFQDYQVVPVSLMVSEKQVFAVCGIQVFPVFHGYLNGWGRGVFVVFEWNAKVGKDFVKFWIAVQSKMWLGFTVQGLVWKFW